MISCKNVREIGESEYAIKRIGMIVLMTAMLTNSIVYAGSLISDGTGGGALRKVRENVSKSSPSEASPSEASPSEATPSEPQVRMGTPVVEIDFESAEPEDVPSWYTKIKGRLLGGRTHYEFEDRYGNIQHRIYGYYDEETDAEWYECDERGRVTNESQWIDLLWEDWVLAPLRWESAEVGIDITCELSCQLYGVDDHIVNSMDFEVVDSELGENYDGTFYDVWWLGEDLLKHNSPVRYFIYGRAVNAEMEDKWLECTESGVIIDKVNMLKPSQVPSWYIKGSRGTVDLYFFVDRTGCPQYRIYTVSSGIMGWYACDEKGNLSDSRAVDIQSEDMVLAPYRYKSAGITDSELQTFLYGENIEVQQNGRIGSEVLSGSNYDNTRYDFLHIYGNVQEGSDSDSYYLYGTIVNSEIDEADLDPCWYRCDEQGKVLGNALNYKYPDPGIMPLSLSRGADVTAVEKTLAGSSNVTIFTASDIPNGGRLIIDCGLAKKYGNQVAINDYLGASNSKHKVIIFYKADKAWTNLQYYHETWAEGHKWVYAPIDENAYWYAGSKMNLSSHWSWSISEVNAGGYYYDSDSEGSTWSPIPMKTDYFTMVRQHTYGDWSIVKAATCTETGLKKRTCAGCGTAETQVTSALGHLWENNYYTGADDGTYYKRCVRNGCNSKTDVKNNPYTVTFLSNNGEEKAEVQDFVYNITQPLKAHNFKKDHHSFINWSEQPDGSGAVYYDKESVNNLTPVYSGNLQLYAQWQPDQYDITYHDSLDGTQNITKALSYTLNLGELPVFTRPGYTQIGFGTDRTGGEKITEETAVPGSDTTYYAQWSPNQYDLIFHTQDSFWGSRKKTVTYDSAIGILPTPSMEAYKFLGWYAEPYSHIYQEGIMFGEQRPSDLKKAAETDIYQVAGDLQVYAYFTLIYRDIGNGTNQRPGPDGDLDTEDDTFYLNGRDGLAGTRDDKRIYPGQDGQYGTEDDYYMDEKELKIYSGPDKTFQTKDDYRDNKDGTNTRPGQDHEFETADDILAFNGLDGISGTKDDWVDNSCDYPGTNLRPGLDGVFGTEDDEVYWNGPDGKPGTEDDRLIHPGPDGQYGTEDDCYDNKEKQEGTNVRPGPDGIFGTEDDELWMNGPDQLPGTKDDMKYMRGNSSGGSGGFSVGRLVGRSVLKPLFEIGENDGEITSLQSRGLLSSVYMGLNRLKEDQLIIHTETDEVQKELIKKRQETVDMEQENGEEVTDWHQQIKQNYKDTIYYIQMMEFLIILLFLLCISGYLFQTFSKKNM